MRRRLFNLAAAVSAIAPWLGAILLPAILILWFSSEMSEAELSFSPTATVTYSIVSAHGAVELRRGVNYGIFSGDRGVHGRWVLFEGEDDNRKSGIAGFSILAERFSAANPRQAAPRYVALMVPYWFISLCCAGPCILWHVRRARRAKRVSAGKCPRCGYDLRATPDRCPECGTAVDAAAGAAR